MTHVTPVVDQKSFRGRRDDVTLNSVTFNGGGGLNTNWTQITDTNFRIRFTIQETAGAAIAQAYQLMYSYDGAAYAVVNSSATHVRPSLSGNFADHDNATQVLGTGTGTFVDGDGLESSEDTDSISIAASGNTELEFCLQILGSQVQHGKTINFRVYVSNNNALDTYTVTAGITVDRANRLNSVIAS